MAVPMFNEHPIEMGIKGNEAAIVARFASNRADAELFAGAFPGDALPVSLDNAVKAIASFERTLTSAGSPFDRYLYRDERDALDAGGETGHGAVLLGPSPLRPVPQRLQPVGPDPARSGCRRDRRSTIPGCTTSTAVVRTRQADRGIFDVTHQPADMGRFRAPTLRNIAVTAPYMHDGSVPTLEAAVAHYASGGVDSPFKSPRIRPFRITAAESHDLIAFLNALTDREFLTDPALAKP